MMQNVKPNSGRKCFLPTLPFSKSVAGVRVEQRFRLYQRFPRDGGFSRCGTCFAFFSQRYHSTAGAEAPSGSALSAGLKACSTLPAPTNCPGG
jgi:hypothetical protein